MSDQTKLADAAADLLTQGGDARIRIDPATGLNQYFASPRPSAILAYASSTANDISAPAFDHVRRRLGEVAPDGFITPEGYAEALEALRGRLRAAYALDEMIDIVFAPSGTDLEYVGLALVKGRAGGGVRNILLGADEVGSGCIHSAHGRFFAAETARGMRVTPGQSIGGRLPEVVELIDIPVRHPTGAALHPAEIAARIDQAVADTVAAGAHALVHIVHGSKTGLVLPALADIDVIAARYGDAVSFIVDACQARITSAAIADYLARGITMFLTGSKFMGGPPFNGFALVPRAAVLASAPLPVGLCKVFRRAEWPLDWPDADLLAREANLGLLLRLEASIFELERFQVLPLATITRVILAFHAAVRAELIDGDTIRRVAPYAPGERQEGDSHPIEMRTLSTLDISRLNGGTDFEESKALHRALIDRGVRLGQPVKCIALPDGHWGGTLRIGLSMPQVVAFAGMDDAALQARLAEEMATIRRALSG